MKDDTSKVGKMMVEIEVEVIICRRIESTPIHDDSDLIPMMKDVRIEPIAEKMNGLA